ncbi:MAG: NAD(P)-dependent oxidoreductase [Deltaproteobacteria bacterium]|jgi:nucleoside-diphosphate-sugar epimerase|nr:NAD(P)-dependent oxidoreductase [Deltaproteobacteria bacterium]
MRVLLLGGAGYIGQVAAGKLLEEGFEVHTVDSLIHGPQAQEALFRHKGFSFDTGDLNDPELMGSLAAGHDAVVLLAGLVGEAACDRDPRLTLASNYLSPLLLLEACLFHGKVGRFVFISTDSCYGNRPGEILDEEAELRPISLYAALKARLEGEILGRAKGSNLTATVLRFATVYGLAPRTRFDLAVNILTREATLRKVATIYSGEQWRPLVHVSDAAGAIAMALKEPTGRVGGQILNVGSNDQNVRFDTLGRLIAELVPGSEIVTVPGAPDLRDYHVSFGKIAALGFKAKVSLRDGIRGLRDALIKGEIADPYDPSLRNA